MDHPHHPAHITFGVAATALVAVLGFHFLLFTHMHGFAFGAYLLILAGLIVGLYAMGGRQGNSWSFLFLAPLLLAVIAESLYASTAVQVLGFACSMVSLAMFTYWLPAPSERFWDLRTLWPGAMLGETLFPFPRFKGFIQAFIHGKSEFRRVLIGVVVAVPFLFVIGLLFVSSDLLLQKSLSDLLSPELMRQFLARSFWDVFAAIFFLSAGWTVMTRMLESRRAKTPTDPEGFDAVVVTTFLSLMNALFIAFIVFQFVSIFGGVAAIEARGISYATYAREGFFQLLAVSVIILGVIAGIYHYTSMKAWAVRWLSAALVVETGVVIVSALRRMALYIEKYGLSLQRVWSTYAMILIAIAFIVLLACMFAKVRFAQVMKSLAVGALIMVSASLLVNMEDLIVHWNFDRFISQQTGNVDLNYLESLSSDAVPALVEYSNAAWPKDQATLASQSYLEVLKVQPQNVYDDSYHQIDDRVNLKDHLGRVQQRLNSELSYDWLSLVVSDYRALAALSTLTSK